MLKLLSKVLERPFAPTPPKKAPGAPKEPTGTRLSSTPARVREFLAGSGAKRVLIHADRATFAAVKPALGAIETVWASNELDDVEAGAAHVEDLDWRGFDVAVVAGNGLPRRYRQAVRLMAATDPTRPVFWIGENFEFCGGTLSAPRSEARRVGKEC